MDTEISCFDLPKRENAEKEVQIYREVPWYLVCGMDMRCARCFAKRFSCLADTRAVAAVAK
ncbi:hypothetical protein GCM10009093_25740 [Brevundimonas terrae]|uniref:Radical SAM protein n=1 Tax=Brevundimonas terrae TaxID=363631 RepID=A0ABP3ICQ5_9CAUL